MEEMKGNRTIGAHTDILSNLVTNHGKQIGAFKPNERVKVLEVDVNGNETEIQVLLFEEKSN